MRRILGIACAAALGVAVSAAEDPRSCVIISPQAPEVHLSGNPMIDFAGQRDLEPRFQEGARADVSGGKSPWLAGVLSLAVPGAGEFYSESYLKSGLFFAAEIVLWALASSYDHKGDRQTDFFQNYANAHWSVVRYAEWTQKNFGIPDGTYNWHIPGTDAYPPWEQINWSELNRMEQSIGTYYSHILPAYNTQQYYELIGKYPQFNQGWDDAAPTFNYGDALTSRFVYYSLQRGQANTYYDRASTFIAIVVVNHVVSAIDAALTAGSYDKGLHASVGSINVPDAGGYVTVPTLHLSYGL
ncbi:MAG TPA: hypothetical protein VEO56_04175 [Bacteroidota bacterium]|nr:hypothetical protein [Bacteroidota bacterium]